jgi:Tfp pilus assembly protein PilN
MRAVNLMPADQRRGASGAAGRSAGGAYVLLGLIAGLVALGGLYAIARHQVSDRTTQAARLTAEAAQDQARADSLKSYSGFIALRDQRVQAVEQLAATRFDWAHAFHEIGRVLPVDVALTALTGTMGSGTGAAPAAPSASATGGTPAIEISGCAVSQPVVAETLERLRGIDGATDVSLESSDKSAPTAAAATTSAGTAAQAPASTGPSDCRQGHPGYPLFKIRATFTALPSATPPAAAGATAAPPATGSTPATPAASTPAATPAASTPAATPAASTPTATPAASTPTATK